MHSFSTWLLYYCSVFGFEAAEQYVYKPLSEMEFAGAASESSLSDVNRQVQCNSILICYSGFQVIICQYQSIHNHWTQEIIDMKYKLFFTQLAVITLITIFTLSSALAADEVRTETVHFAKGASSASIKDSVKGYNSVNYVLGAAAGQTMSVLLDTSNSSNYFNVTAPGSDTAMFVGSSEGNEFSATLPEKGDYTVQVYLMRNAARRNETANYTITFEIR